MWDPKLYKSLARNSYSIGREILTDSSPVAEHIRHQLEGPTRKWLNLHWLF